MSIVKTLRRFSFRFLLLFAIIPLCWVMAGHYGFLDYFEYLTVDWRFRQRGEIEAPVKLIYVDLDSEALEFMGERPLPRSYFAQTVEALLEHGKAKVVGIDAVFSGLAHSVLVDEAKIQADTKIFREIVQKSPGLVLAAAYTQREDHVTATDKKQLLDFPYIHRGYRDPNDNGVPEMPEISLIGTDGGNIGIINTADHYSPGSITRWVPAFAQTAGPVMYTMSLELIRIYQDLSKDNIEILKDEILFKDNKGDIKLAVPLQDEQLIEVNWFTPWLSDYNPRYSIKTILAARAWLEAGDEEQKAGASDFFKSFEDAIILIGPTDPLLHDLSPTPFDKASVPRVGIHGNLIKTILSERYLDRPGLRWNIVFAYLLTLIVSVLSAYPGRYGLLFKILSVFLLIGYVLFAFSTFSNLDWVLPIIMPIGSAVSTAFGMIMIQLIETERQRSEIKGMFGSYVSPDLVEHMVEQEENPKLGGSEEEVSALFSDIESFTSICEDLTPTNLINLINEYLGEMTRVIQEEKGTLDKYIGDAIVSMFGAPVKIQNHAEASCRAACKMLQCQNQLREKWNTEASQWTDKILNMHTRIGINTGLVTVGNMGSEIRFNYTMLGDNVNLAARCESGAKAYGVYCIATEYTHKQAQHTPIAFRYLHRIIVKGKTTPVGMYEILGFQNEISKKTEDCIDLYQNAFQEYLARDWDSAIDLFNKSELFELNRGDNIINPSKLFIDRCQQMKSSNLPDDWDGVFTMKTK